MTSNRLFVLQLLQLQTLGGAFEQSGSAIFVGNVYRTKTGFPVLSQEGSQSIFGSIYEFQMSDVQLSLMDEMMGFNPQNLAQSLHHRTLVNVKLSGAESATETVWVYVLNPLKHSQDLRLVEDGDWQSALSAHPPLTEKLTDKQKTYIKKLGVSSGREVVPINLPLYRELMNLELIVDKGRRLALSKFGQEVFRYLE